MPNLFYNPDDNVSNGNPLLQEHIGIVVDDKDPLNLCRIRVFIPGVIDQDNSTWITRVVPTIDGMVYSTPRVGQRVRVWFRNGNIDEGVYGLDYVHTNEHTNKFTAGDLGFSDNKGNVVRFRGNTLTIETKQITVKGSLSVQGNLSSSSGFSGSFTTSDGKTVTVDGGSIISVV